MKKFAIDVHLDYANTYEVEAESREEAVERIRRKIRNGEFDPEDFELTEDWEVACSGEEDDDGLVSYF